MAPGSAHAEPPPQWGCRWGRRWAGKQEQLPRQEGKERESWGRGGTHHLPRLRMEGRPGLKKDSGSGVPVGAGLTGRGAGGPGHSPPTVRETARRRHGTAKTGPQGPLSLLPSHATEGSRAGAGCSKEGALPCRAAHPVQPTLLPRAPLPHPPPPCLSQVSGALRIPVLSQRLHQRCNLPVHAPRCCQVGRPS